MKRLVGMAVAVSALLSFAEADPYAGYIQLKTSDNPSTSSTSWTSSWGNQGRWDDTEGPVSTKNYYVPSGRTLACPDSRGGSDKAGANDWKGGQLVIGGRLQVMVTSKAARLPKVDDLVFLENSQLYSRWNVFGFLNSRITVLATAERPLLVDASYGSSAYTMAITGSKFFGNADAGMVLRCSSTKGSALTYYNFEAETLKDYYGRVVVTNGLTGFRTQVDNARVGGTLEAVDGAFANMANGTTVGNVYLGGLDVHDGGVLYVHNSGGTLYPQFNISNSVRIANGGIVSLAPVDSSAPLAVLRNFMVPSGDALEAKLGKLTETSATSDFEDGKVDFAFTDLGFDALAKQLNWAIATKEGEEDGVRDVIIRADDVAFYKGTDGDALANGAFHSGNEGNWSTGAIPATDSTGHFMIQSRLTIDQNLLYPKATLTLGNRSSNSWPQNGGSTKIEFETINFISPMTLNTWKSTSSSYREIGGSVVNALGAETVSLAIVTGGQTVDVKSELRGTATVCLRLHSTQCKATSTWNLVNLNTNFTGRLIVGSVSRTSTFSESGCVTRSRLNDARNWGGPYAGDDAWQAVTVADAEVIVSNSVAFTEPTRGIHLLRFARIGVDEGKTMKLANQVTFAGRVDKQGAGTLELAGSVRFIDGEESTAPAEGANVLTVTEGAVRVSSATACDGLQMVLRDGGKLVVPYGSETGIVDVKWDEPFVAETTDGRIPLEVDLGNANPGPGFTTKLFTVSAAAAANLSADDFRFTCSNRKFKFASLNRTYDEATDAYTYSATFEVRGILLIVR